MSVKLLHGDCRQVLRTLPDASVHCCVTSPPYFGLRDYGVEGQIGLEDMTDTILATLQAAAALRGIEVNPDGSGGYVVRMQGHPWERAAADMDALVALLGRMGVVA